MATVYDAMSVPSRAGLLVLFCLTTSCLGPARYPSSGEPALAILLVIDQLRPDLLDRYDALFVGGLRRLLDEGYRFTNATHDHAMTATAPGHTTLSTGVYPSRHGIVGNSWSEFELGEWRSVYSAEDRDRTILGHPALPGRSSANTDRPGLPDWIVASDSGSRVVSISRKDRAAIALAAKAVGDVYWLLQEEGRFVTSDFYQSEYPGWVERFNQATMPRVYADTVWNSTVPSAARSLSRPDTSVYESNGEQTAFPHRGAERMGSSDAGALNRWRYLFTPLPDRAVVSFALNAIEELELGRRGSLDYLGISLSQVDEIGHSFGPLSREQLDNLLRLDRELARLFSSLDEALGAGNWVLAMSADHGVLGIPEQLAEEGADARRLPAGYVRDLRARVTAALERRNEDDDPDEIARTILMNEPFVSAVYTFAEVETGVPVDTLPDTLREFPLADAADRARGLGWRTCAIQSECSHRQPAGSPQFALLLRPPCPRHLPRGEGPGRLVGRTGRNGGRRSDACVAQRNRGPRRSRWTGPGRGGSSLAVAQSSACWRIGRNAQSVPVVALKEAVTSRPRNGRVAEWRGCV
ncbi:MAG: alkaline phosphatase family protein [Gemmatimonadota bacterium]|nr:alkaline phosphatase family protein [Gemmatimonadota bacterium]